VVYLGDGISASYVPVSSLKNRPLSSNLQAIQALHGLQGLSSTSTTVHTELENGSMDFTTEEEWRRHPESWDREHRRYRPNTTRVQRKFLKN
jgi:hypothetical protein